MNDVQRYTSEHNTVKMGKPFEFVSILQNSLRKCYNTPLFELKYICWLSRSFEFGDDKLYQQRRWAEDLEKETKSFINAVSQARIRLRVLSRNKVTCGLELDTQFGVLKRKLSHLEVKSVIGHLENGGLGYVKFDMWKWPTRKKINGTQCRTKPMKWKFDMWRWPKRKKERRNESYVKPMFWYEDLYKEFRLECCRKGAVVLLFMFDAVVDGSSKIQRGNEVKTKFAREGIKYEMGEWVYLKLQPYMLISVRKSHHNKFSANVYDPYQVTVERGKVTCKLETLEKAKIHQER
ncbi:hypothetical protein Tco_0900472 [Tanacetum coccineum]